MNALIEPFFYCLLASMIWAPAVFLVAAFVTKKDKSPAGVNSLSGRVWPLALVLAALPVLIAPIVAALGLSLRSPAPLPPMAELAGPAIVAVEAMDTAVYEAQTTISLADMLRTMAILYFYGFLMLLALAAIRHVWFSYRLNYAVSIDEPKLEAALEKWRVQIGVTRRPRYVFSHIVTSVCVYGFFRPVVVMPYNLLDRISIEDAALMGAHEMAHIKRGDVALFALCSVAKAVFWFNPFMHRICARANLAAEQGADALVLARGVDRRQYAHCFVQGLRLAAGTRNGFAGEFIPSFTPFDKRSRRERLDAILSGQSEASFLSLGNKVALGAGAVAAAGLAFAQAAFAVSPPPVKEALPVAPVEGEISAKFGTKGKFLGDDRPSHEGIDIRAALGTPVRAPGDGKVIDATDHYRSGDAWGKVVVIDHGHGLVTRFAHLDSYLVKKGDKVRAGDVIAAVGTTGKSTGPHLHFEVIQDGEMVDPAPLITAMPSPAATPAVPSVPSIRTTRSVNLVPAPRAVSITPPVIHNHEDIKAAQDVKRARKIEKKLAELDQKFREQFQNFDAFEDLEGVNVRLNDMKIEGSIVAERLAEAFEGYAESFEDLNDIEFDFSDGPRVFANFQMSDEEREEIRRARDEAMRDAEEAMRDARDEMRNVERDRARALAEMARDELRAEKDNEQMREEIKREHERAAKEWEREMKAAQVELDRTLAQAQRDIEKAQLQRTRSLSEAEILEHREEALRAAKDDLERELEEIERRREELEARQWEEDDDDE